MENKFYHISICGPPVQFLSLVLGITLIGDIKVKIHKIQKNKLLHV